MKSTALAFALAFVPATLLAAPVSLSSAQIVALVKATPQLKIDSSVPPTSAYDAKTHPYVDVLGVPEGQSIGGYIATDYAHEGTLGDGDDVLAVPLDSGGSGGIFTQIVFVRHGGYGFVYAGHIDSGGHLDVRIKDGVIVATLPYYGANDPNCCPSKRTTQTYTVQNGRLHKLSEKTVPIPKPT